MPATLTGLALVSGSILALLSFGLKVSTLVARCFKTKELKSRVTHVGGEEEEWEGKGGGLFSWLDVIVWAH